MRSIVLAGLTCLAATACSRGAARIDAPAAAIVVHAETAALSPADADSAIARPIAGALARVDGIAHVVSESNAGEVRVTATLAPGASIDAVATATDDALRELVRQLPPIAPPELERRRRGTVIRAIARSTGANATEVRTWVDWDLRRALLATPGVIDADACGGAIAEIGVRLDPAKLASFGLDVDAVVSAIGAARNAPAGDLHAADRAFVVRAAGSISIDALRPMPIAYANGAPVVLAQLATIDDLGRPDPCTAAAPIGVVLDVRLRPDADARAVTAAIETAARGAPTGVTIEHEPAPARYSIALAADAGVDLRPLAAAWRGALVAAPGVLAVDRAPGGVDVFAVDRAAAADAGVDAASIARTIEAMTSGVIAGETYQADRHFDVRVSIAADSLDAVRVRARAGLVPLSSLVRRSREPARVDGADGSPAQIVTFALADGADADTAAATAIAHVRAAAPPPPGAHVLAWREP